MGLDHIDRVGTSHVDLMNGLRIRLGRRNREEA